MASQIARPDGVSIELWRYRVARCRQKTRYNTKKNAYRAQSRFDLVAVRNVSIYHCCCCGGYHLTSNTDMPTITLDMLKRPL